MKEEDKKEEFEVANSERIAEENLQYGHPVELQNKSSMSFIHEVIFVAVLCSSQLSTMAALAQSIAPINIIGKSFGISNPGQLSWFTAAHSLTVGTFMLIAGRFGDIFGHKSLFIAGFIWFALWSLLAGFSVYSDAIFFDICRAFQGIGPAFAVPNAIAILGRTYSPGWKKNIVFSMFAACAPTGFVMGSVFSSLLSRFAWWPWSFWIMAIFCLLLATLGFLVIQSSPMPKRDSSFKLFQRVDALGSISGVSGLILINFAWNEAPVVGWQKPYTYALLIVGALCMGLFVWFEYKAVYPLVPIKSLSSDAAFMLGCVGVGWSSCGIWIYYSWMFMLNIKKYPPLLCSAHFFPVCLSGTCAAVTAGYLLKHYPGSITMIFAMISFTVGLILMSTVPVHQTYWAQFFVSILVMPWGMDMSFPSATIVLSDQMPGEHQGLAASLVNTMVNYSISIGLGIAGTVEAHLNDDGRNVLRGYRSAMYTGIGLGGLGIALASCYAGKTFIQKRSKSSTVP
ncbi:hypothetical protein ZYGR_0AI00130 [Zygosaccharomyces rouxii]|uniref:Major facilitator superfamily (MFS) profile domain-containing protein n=1 Tax=Zygosaccharomyces rouxii TaxID=4956 RepID=A0A1Q3AAT8_ZYGRO|nr:hypothetical protein ZYGR_0AI00130 [Zygosaccharomyces rouxii]